MLTITSFSTDPIHYFPYQVVAAGAPADASMTCTLSDTTLPIYHGTVKSLPPCLDALFLTSDLQGHCQLGDDLELMGLSLPGEISLLIELAYPQLDPRKTGVILCGDLYANPYRRGGSGDVRQVWHAFRREFKWVSGVVGNHDKIGEELSGQAHFFASNQMCLLEQTYRHWDGLQLAGMGGIIGSPRKLHRRTATDFLQQLQHLLQQQPDLLLLHEGPSFPEPGFLGRPEIRETISQASPTLVCFGHVHWPEPLRELSQGTQLLNLDGRGVLLTRE